VEVGEGWGTAAAAEGIHSFAVAAAAAVGTCTADTCTAVVDTSAVDSTDCTAADPDCRYWEEAEIGLATEEVR
jgi:hypothetical protein